MLSLTCIPAPVNATADTWPDWTDSERWELGPDCGDPPTAPYTREDAEWWAEQTRDDDPSVDDDADVADPAYHAFLDGLASERDAEERYCRGLVC